MPTPRIARPKTDFSRVPNPATLPPEVKQELLAQPWFRKVIKMHMSGKRVTPEMMDEESKKPGAMGFVIDEYDFGNGQKMKGLFDVATGEFVPPDRLVKPEFRASLQEMFNPSTGESEGTVLQTSPSSVVPWQKNPQKAPLMQSEYETFPIKSRLDNKVVGEFVITPGSNEVQFVRKDKSIADQMMEFEAMKGLMGGGGQPGAAPAAPATPQPAAAAMTQAATPRGVDTAFVVKTADDYARVPVGAEYLTPDGRRKKKTAQPSPQK